MLSRDEQRVLRAIGGWTVAQALLGHPDRISEYAGRSHFSAYRGDERDHVEYNRTRIAVGAIGALRGKPVFTVKWAAVVRHGKELSTDLLDRLRDQQQRSQLLAAEHMGKCWPPPAYAPKIGPLTREQYDRTLAREHYDREVWRPYVEATRALRAELAGLLDEAFPLAADNEPADLLELLAATGGAA